MFFFSSSSSQNLPTYPPTQFYVLSLSLKYKNNKKFKHKNRKSKQESKTPIRQEVPKWNKKFTEANMEFLLCWPLAHGHGPALERGWYTQWHFIGENWLSLCQWVSIANSFSVRGWTMYLLFPLNAGTHSGLNLCWSYAWCHSLCGFTYASVQCSRRHCFLAVILHVWLLQFFCLLFHIDFWALRGRVWWKNPI